MFDNISGKFQALFKKLRGRGKLTEANIKDAIKDVKVALLEADVNYHVVKEFIEMVKVRALGKEVMGSLLPGQQMVKIFHEEMTKLMGHQDKELNISGKPFIIMLVGLQGSGKTTMCAKLANFLKNRGHRVCLIPVDPRRPAAEEQLRVLGKRAGVEVTAMGNKGKASEIVKEALRQVDATGSDVAILDTGGRLHVDDELMNELLDIKGLIKPQQILLVVDGMTGQDAVKEASEFERRIGIDGIILTKLDGDARGGAALSVRKVTGKPVKFIGVGERIDALEPFYPDRIASRILGMGDVLSLVEKVESSIKEDDRKKLEKKLMKEKLTLGDLLSQIKLMKKIGSLQEFAEMLPGGGNISGTALDDKKLKHTEAIIQSMTEEEREDYSIIDGSRRRRIAGGSGTSVQEVNALLRQFQQIGKFVKHFRKKSFTGGGFKWRLS